MEETLALFSSTVRMATPLLFAAMAGVCSERSGVVNIALEGKMLFGALVAAIVALMFESPWLGFVGGGLAGLSTSVVYGLCVLNLKTNQIVAGTAINLLAVGVPPLVCKTLYGVMGSTPSLPIESRFVSAPVYVAWISVLVVSLYLRFTPAGLRLQFAGEKPEALSAAGCSVLKTRWNALLLAGFLAGLGGATLSICLSSAFARNMTAGRGFMALAAVILGKWRPLPAAMACLLFAFFEALQIQLQGMGATTYVPVQFIQILPYVLTLIILAGFVGRSRPPAKLGVPY